MSARPLLNPGTILAGRWQIQDYIGSGDTGEVYGVRDMHSAGSFALKLFWPSALGQAELWTAVQQTARTASGLGVDGVARAYDFGIDANSARPFFVSERVSWSSLADRVRLHGPLTPADLAVALGVLARALDAAHAVGLVHRDLKPENVFVSQENPNWVRISDFGAALLRSASPPPPGWGGTLGFTGPDAADPNAPSTRAMDIFALGLVAFFALTGGALHRAARANPIDPGALWQELGALLDSASLRARELGAALDPVFDDWFQRAVAATPEARFHSVGEMASAFEARARTLFAPQSQNAVALPGVAVAIAQPLIFQPESLPPPTAARPVPTAATVVSPVYDASADDPPSSGLAAPKKRSFALLFIGGAVICFALTALGAVGLYQHRRALADEAEAQAVASASAAAAAATAAAATASATAEAVAAAPPSVSTALPASAAATTAAPSATALASPHTPHEPAKPEAVKAAVTPTPPTVIPGPVAAKPSPAAAKSKAVAAVAAAKPASPQPPAPAKPVSVAPKKKCGSVFIPCK